VLPGFDERSDVNIVRLPAHLLRFEGLAVLVGAIILYHDADYSWLLFVALFLAPDLSMIGYAGGSAIGALTYNAVHTYVLPIALGLAGVLGDSSTASAIALIWLAHIGADRLLGYGLKYPTAFKDTHLQRV
jgi:hypothetical protein